jgi:hypothetical protein
LSIRERKIDVVEHEHVFAIRLGKSLADGLDLQQCVVH